MSWQVLRFTEDFDFKLVNSFTLSTVFIFRDKPAFFVIERKDNTNRYHIFSDSSKILDWKTFNDGEFYTSLDKYKNKLPEIEPITKDNLFMYDADQLIFKLTDEVKQQIVDIIGAENPIPIFKGGKRRTSKKTRRYRRKTAKK
jgi:hypothetical protein